MNASMLKSIAFSILTLLLAGCETVDSQDVDTGDVIAGINAYRVTTISDTATTSRVEVVAILREDAGGRPYIDLSGGDTLELIVDSNTVTFSKDDDTFNSIRYLAEWDKNLTVPSILTVRFTRGSGETHDSTITIGAPVDTVEPTPGFSWRPNAEDLVVSWEAADPSVTTALVTTACTEQEVRENLANRTFTITAGTLVRDDASRDQCIGHVELVQDLLEGTTATELSNESSITLDQATRLSVEAQF
jgi:hypothetical protein